MKTKIYLSPSNQNRNIYCDGRNECDVCYEVAQYIEKWLRNNPKFEVYLAKKDSTLAERVRESNIFNADYHITIHTNAGGGEGTRIFVHPQNFNNSLAKRILKYVGDWSIGKVDKIVTNTTFYEIMKTDAKAIYIEGEFHDTNGNYIKAEEYAESIYNALIGEFSPESKSELTHENTNVDNGEKFYRVQVGAYNKRENAERMCRELRQKGLSAYINYS